jgi:hypothetical protein
MSGILEGDTDLFGLPLLADRGRGRPAHAWTVENSNKVNLLFACGHKPAIVARVLGITKPTFYKHYFNEISRAGFAPLMLRARQLERLNAEAEKGNVAAERALAAMVHAEQIQTTAQRISERGAPIDKKSAPLGKKASAVDAAQRLGGRFATRQPPPSMLIN